MKPIVNIQKMAIKISDNNIFILKEVIRNIRWYIMFLYYRIGNGLSLLLTGYIQLLEIF